MWVSICGQFIGSVQSIVWPDLTAALHAGPLSMNEIWDFSLFRLTCKMSSNPHWRRFCMCLQMYVHDCGESVASSHDVHHETRCVTCSFSLCRCRTCVTLMLMSVTLCNCCDVTARSFLARFHVEICCFNPRGSAQWYNLAQNLTCTSQTHKLGRCLELRDVNCKKNLFILVTPKPVLYIYFECFNLL